MMFFVHFCTHINNKQKFHSTHFNGFCYNRPWPSRRQFCFKLNQNIDTCVRPITSTKLIWDAPHTSFHPRKYCCPPLTGLKFGWSVMSERCGAETATHTECSLSASLQVLLRRKGLLCRYLAKDKCSNTIKDLHHRYLLEMCFTSSDGFCKYLNNSHDQSRP